MSFWERRGANKMNSFYYNRIDDISYGLFAEDTGIGIINL